jgi:hypothetical protein
VINFVESPFGIDRCLKCNSSDTFKTHYGFRCNGCGTRNYVLDYPNRWMICLWNDLPFKQSEGSQVPIYKKEELKKIE